MLKDLKEILSGVISVSDLEKSIECALNHEECDEAIPFIEFEENYVRCEFETNGKEIGSKEIRITIQIINGTKYYFLGGATYERSYRTPSGKIYCDDGMIMDYETRINRFKEALERYIEE